MIAVAALAQTASEKPSVDVRRVGARLQCQCGCRVQWRRAVCWSATFPSPPRNGSRRCNRWGWATGRIIDAFLQEYGAGIYLAPPNLFGMLVPYVAVGLGLLAIWWFIRRYRPPPLAEVDAIQLGRPRAGQV